MKHSSGFQTKATLFFLVSAIIPVTFVGVFLFGVTNASVMKIQQADAANAMNRAIYAMDEYGRAQMRLALDYAHWDETYDPKTGRDPLWLRENILESVPERFGIDFILMADENGKIFASHEPPVSMTESVADVPFFRQAVSGEQAVSFLDVDGVPSLVTAVDIMPTDQFSDPGGRAGALPRGVLVYGKYLTVAIADVLARTTGSGVAFAARRGYLVADSFFKSDEPVESFEELVMSRDTIEVHADLYDAHHVLLTADGDDAAVMLIRQGRSTEFLVTRSAAVSALIGLLASAAIALLLGQVFSRSITGPVLELAKEVREFDGTKQFAARAVERKDEIGFLLRSFHELMARLGKTNLELSEAARELKTKNIALQESVELAETAKDQIKRQFDEIENINKLMVNRENRMVELKEEPRKKEEDLASLKKKKSS